MIVTCDKVSKAFGAHVALREATFEVDFPSVLAFIGPSGGGKSTLLRILAGLVPSDAGTVTVEGKKLPNDEASLRAYRRRVGVVFQSFNLFPHLTALENVLLPLEKVQRFPDARARAFAQLERFRLAAHTEKRPAQLSGGERQRVAIARALAIEPEFLVMDEPTSALDPEMTAEVLEMVAGLREAGRPLLLATHEMGFARQAADQVVFVAEGRVVECTPAAEFFAQPRTEAARRFLERILKY